MIDDWKDISAILVPICFMLLFIFVVEYQKAEVENKFLREKIEEQRVIIEKMESD